MRQPANLPEDASHQPDTDRLIGQCPAMQDLYKSIGRVAAQDVTVLLLGESGTGKELVARAVYQHSHRAGKPFLAVNCAAIAVEGGRRPVTGSRPIERPSPEPDP